MTIDTEPLDKAIRDVGETALRIKAERDKLLQILNDRCDTVDGEDGQPRLNEAASILSEFEGWKDGWIK